MGCWSLNLMPPSGRREEVRSFPSLPHILSLWKVKEWKKWDDGKRDSMYIRYPEGLTTFSYLLWWQITIFQNNKKCDKILEIKFIDSIIIWFKFIDSMIIWFWCENFNLVKWPCFVYNFYFIWKWFAPVSTEGAWWKKTKESKVYLSFDMGTMECHIALKKNGFFFAISVEYVIKERTSEKETNYLSVFNM